MMMMLLAAALAAGIACATGMAARAALDRIAYGWLAAAIVVATPLVWTIGDQPRLLLAMLAVATWLAAVSLGHLSGHTGWWLLAGATLGAGLWTTWSAATLLPMYALLTLAAFSLPTATRWRVREATAFAVAFSVSSAPFAVSIFLRWDDVRRLATQLRLYDAERFSVLQGLREMTSWVGLTARIGVYWDAFDPAFVFLYGDLLAWPLMMLVPLGIWRLLDAPDPVGRLALGGVLLAPLAAALTAEPPLARRMYALVPCAAVTAAYGVAQVAAWARRWPRRCQAAKADAP